METPIHIPARCPRCFLDDLQDDRCSICFYVSGTPLNTLPAMNCEELDRWCARSIEESEARFEADGERLAIQRAAFDDGKTTTENALAALSRPERFSGEHDIARLWLRQHNPTAGIFTQSKPR